MNVKIVCEKPDLGQSTSQNGKNTPAQVAIYATGISNDKDFKRLREIIDDTESLFAKELKYQR
jgi:hypothetical protein